MLNHNNYPDHIKIFPVNGKVFTTWLKLKTCLIFLPQHPNPNPIGQYHQNISFFFSLGSCHMACGIRSLTRN